MNTLDGVWSDIYILQIINEHELGRLTKILQGELDFKNIKFLVKIRYIHKIEKKNCISIRVFGYENNKNIHSICQICCEEKHIDLLLIEEEDKRHYVLINIFNTFMYDYSLHYGKKYFCRYCLQAFSTARILKDHINGCFKINGK